MSLQFFDRVQEATSSTGTTPFVLAGAPSGFLPFSTIGNTNTCYYSAWDGAANWEVGLGTYATSGNTLTRTTILASSNAGSAVSFPISPSVWLDFPASLAAVLSGAATQSKPGNPTAPNSTTLFTMQGLAGAITPKKSGSVLVTITGTLVHSAATVNVGAIWQISHGTGTAPTSNAVLTGTQDGNTVQSKLATAATAAADVSVPFSITALITGLTVGTAIWIDLAAKALTTISIQSLTTVCITAIEV